MKLEIIPVRKDERGNVWECEYDEENATGWGVYCGDDLEATFETREEAEEGLAKMMGWTNDTPPKPQNSLYHVHEYEAGNDTSLLVVAKSVGEAVRFFDEHWQNAYDGYVFDDEILVHVAADFSLDKPGPLRWGVMGGMVLVGKKPLDEWLNEEGKGD